jgi:hypothetical protein
MIEATKDMLGQDLAEGDFVVSFNYIYQLTKVTKNYVTGRLYPPSNSVRNKSLYTRQIVKVPTELVMKK